MKQVIATVSIAMRGTFFYVYGSDIGKFHVISSLFSSFYHMKAVFQL